MQKWTRVDVVAEELKITSPSSFRHCRVQGRNGDKKAFWAFTLSCSSQKISGARVYSLNREALANLLSLSENLFAQGQSTQNILELLMPA